MALRIPQRRLLEPALNVLRTCPSCRQTPYPFRVFARAASSKKVTSSTGSTSIDDFLKKKPKKEEQAVPQRGNVSEDSIFEEAEHGEEDFEEDFEEDGHTSRRAQKTYASSLQARNSGYMQTMLDPDPKSRVKWERKVVSRQVKRRGRLTKKELLKRTERESLTKSQWFKTSTKKLGMLARQIAGKPIEEAIVQMRFSKKRVAQDLKKHLEYSRDMAIVNRGMGLGAAEGRQGEPVEIELKNGKRKKVTDRTGIYVDQAWVGRGPYGSEVDYRARGNANIMKNPYTSVTVLLKEEATRVRLSEERKKKFENRKLWLHLPDRPVTAQRQYPLW
ncbi:ribosomal protein L22 [Venturia nashicola]|uniref:Ribosomal protein L22 n=1 Tax=Venturia nashicola TaxID=86259 RepID=A0A4Z1NNY0_9PEZI|nr:ribosomal protein L22 [Venturia nashicola]TLD26196.1 ribosomal protein L22 [Venturia nashicola]